MAQAPPLVTSSTVDTKVETPKKAAKKRKHGDVGKGTPSQKGAVAKDETPQKAAKKRKHGDVDTGTPNREEAVATPTTKSKKARVEGTNGNVIEHGPAAPPALPSTNGANSVKAAEPSPKLAQSSPLKKSKRKDEAKEEVPSTDTKPSDFKKPAKVTPIPLPSLPGLKST